MTFISFHNFFTFKDFFPEFILRLTVDSAEFFINPWKNIYNNLQAIAYDAN